MEKSLVLEGPTIEECLEQACQQLKCNKKDIDFKVLTEGKKGLFGLMSQPYKIKVTLKEADISEEEKIDKVLEEVDEINVNVDGYCVITREENGIYITVYPPQGNGYRITLDQASKYIEENGIINADMDDVAIAVNNSDAKPVRIADFDPSIYKDGEAKIEISGDKMTASIIISPPKGGNAVTKEEIIELLKKEGINHGIDEETIKNTLENKIFNKPVVVANGTPPKNGDDARVEYKFKPKKEKIFTETENGKVDFHNLNLINNVLKGEIIGEKIPSTPGEGGINIFGEGIPAQPGRDILLTPGKNVSISEDGTKLISEIDGQVTFKKNNVDVLPVFTVDGDVDLSTGNINFVGNVIVKGSILSGFSVTCQGTLEVANTIGSANIDAKGDVIVKGGILGKDKGVILSGGNIIAKFIENSNCSAYEDVICDKAIMHSHIKAKKIHVTGSKGLIVGGNLQAEDEIEAASIGSPLAVKTTLIVGISKEILQRIDSIEKQIEENINNLTRVNQAINMLAKIKERSGTLDEHNLAKLTKTINIKKQIESTLASLEEEKFSLEDQVESSKSGKIKAKKVIYPGVTITIRKGIMQVKDEIKFAKLIYEEGYIKINPFS